MQKRYLVVFVIQNMKTLEHEIFVESDVVLAVRDNGSGQATRCDDGEIFPHFLADAVNHGVDHAGITKHNARAHTIYGVLSDDTGRRFQADLRKLRSA